MNLSVLLDRFQVKLFHLSGRNYTVDCMRSTVLVDCFLLSVHTVWCYAASIKSSIFELSSEVLEKI